MYKLDVRSEEFSDLVNFDISSVSESIKDVTSFLKDKFKDLQFRNQDVKSEYKKDNKYWNNSNDYPGCLIIHIQTSEYYKRIGLASLPYYCGEVCVGECETFMSMVLGTKLAIIAMSLSNHGVISFYDKKSRETESLAMQTVKDLSKYIDLEMETQDIYNPKSMNGTVRITFKLKD